MVEKLVLCLISGFVCPILLETWREIIKRRRERAEKAKGSADGIAVAIAAPVIEAKSSPPLVQPPALPSPAAAASDPGYPSVATAGEARPTRRWPWILLSIVSGLVLGPIVALLVCSSGNFCTGDAAPYFIASIAVCMIAVWILLKVALLPAHGTAAKRVTRIGLRIIVSALIGPVLGIIITLLVALPSGQKDFPTSWFVAASIVCTIMLWIRLNRRGPLRARTGGTVAAIAAQTG
jgi:hypothetical protein